MIIKTDVSNIPLNTAPLARTAPDPAINWNYSENQRITMSSITARLGIERSLGDALSIAQMSQNVIQRAIAISLRLKSIATQAMATGSVNTQALTEAMHDIRTTIGAYGEQLPNPVQPASAPSAKIIEMPDIRNTLSSVQDIAGSLKKGDYQMIEHIEAVNRNLAENLANYRKAEGRITELLRQTTAGYSPVTRIRSGELAGQVKTAIEINPDNALFAQGNINHGAAERLTR